jgi:hypothetical protein
MKREQMKKIFWEIPLLESSLLSRTMPRDKSKQKRKYSSKQSKRRDVMKSRSRINEENILRVL